MLLLGSIQQQACEQCKERGEMKTLHFIIPKWTDRFFDTAGFSFLRISARPLQRSGARLTPLPWKNFSTLAVRQANVHAGLYSPAVKRQRLKITASAKRSHGVVQSGGATAKRGFQKVEFCQISSQGFSLCRGHKGSAKGNRGNEKIVPLSSCCAV